MCRKVFAELMKSYFTVELRIYQRELDISRVSEDMGLAPTSVQLKGEPRGSGQPFSESMWGHGESEGRSLREWDELEAGLASLLTKLDSVKHVLSGYQTHSYLCLWCGYFHSSMSPKITLSPSILSAIGEFGATLEISSYYCEDD